MKGSRGDTPEPKVGPAAAAYPYYSRVRLSAKVIAITGASAGIGRAVALRAAEEGATVILSARRPGPLAAVAEAITAAGGRAIAIPSDVTSASDMQMLVDRSRAEAGRLDVMICNAGLGYHDAFEATPLAVARRLVDVNLMGTFNAAHPAVAAFRLQGHGHLIAISSIVGRRGVGGSAVYSATKAAQAAFIEALRSEFRGSALKASVVYPIATATDFHEAIRREFGRTVGAAGPRQTADQVARAIVNCIVRPRPEVYPYRYAKLLAVLNVAAPAQADRVVHRFRRRSMPAAPESGPRRPGSS
jgi:short-subunit dehydrogenase